MYIVQLTIRHYPTSI